MSGAGSLELTQLITDLRNICEMISAKMHSKYTRLRTFQCKSCSLQWLLSRCHFRVEICKWSRCVTMKCIGKQQARERESCADFSSSLLTLWIFRRNIYIVEKMKAVFRTFWRSVSLSFSVSLISLSLSLFLFLTFSKQQTNARLRMPNSNFRYHDSLTVVLSSLHIYLCILILMKLVFSFHVYIFTQ